MENWKKQLNELMNEFRYFPLEEWNKDLGIWCKEWVDEVSKRSGISARLTSSALEKKITLSKDREAPFICYVNYGQETENGQFVITFRYSTEHHPLRKFKAIMKGEDVNDDESKDYSWAEETLTLIDGPILEKDFVLATLTYILKIWVSRGK
jgi:hypothetical protein